MRQTRDTDQVRERLRLRVQKHLDNEIGTELRHAKTSKRAAADVLRLDAERLGALEQRHDLRVIERNRLRIKVRDILEHTDHGRIIVSENVEL